MKGTGSGLIITWILIHIFFATNAQEYLITEKPNLYKFPVKAVTTLEQRGEQWNLSSYEEYDLSGKKIMEIIYRPDGNPAINILYQYDSTGNIFQKIRNDNESIFYITRFSYLNKSNKISEKTICYSEGIECEKPMLGFNNDNLETEDQGYLSGGNSFYNQFFTYDKKGNLIENTYLSFEGDVVEKIVFEYDSNGKPILQKSLNGKGKLNQRIFYSYDGEGNLISEEISDITNSSRIRNLFRYDEKGRIIESTKISGIAFVLYKTTFQYNKKGWLVSEFKTDSQGINSFIKKFIYDREGRLLEEIVEFPQGYKQIHTYSFNKKGLLTGKVIKAPDEQKNIRFSYEFYE